MTLLSPIHRKIENNKKVSLIGVVLGICIIAVILVAYGQISILQKNTTNLEANNGALLDQLATLAAQKTSLEQQVTSLNADVTSLTNQVTSLQTQATALQNQLTQLQTENTALNSQLTTAKTHLNFLQLQMSADHFTVWRGPHAL